jgi:hypothetical protein
MARVLSFLLATLLVLSAAAEVASFAIDNKSWILENLKAIGSYVTADRGTEQQPQPAAKDCGDACGSTDRPAAVQQGCDDVEPMSKRILCVLTLRKAQPTCNGADCDRKDDGPGNRTPGTKGNMADLER